jgi:hypothetical protein
MTARKLPSPSLAAGPGGALRGRCVRVLSALAAGAVWLAGATASAASSNPEDELKSAAVLSFLRYSDWPAAPGGAITVGVFGRTAFAQALAHTLEGKAVNNRPVHLMEVALTSDLRGCQLVYVAASKTADVRQMAANAAAAHALAIGETDRFLEYGGAINLFLIDGHIGFEVSLETLERSGVVISSKMLRLGQIRDSRRGRPSP